MFATHEIGINDIWHIYYPFKQFLHEQLSQNRIPLWNNQIANGFPVHAEGQIGIFNVINLVLFKFLDPVLAFDLGIIFSFLICALGVFLVGRQLKLSYLGSVFISLVYSLSGFFIVRVSHYSLLQSAAFFPLIIYFLFKYIKDKKTVFGILYAVSLSQQIFAGHIQMTAITLIFVFLYIIYLIITKNMIVKVALRLFGFTILGLLLSSALLFPTAELTLISQRAGGLKPSENTYFKFPFGHLLTFLNPFWFGNPQSGTYPHFFKFKGSIFWENTGYTGIVPLILFFIGLFNRKLKFNLFWTGIMIFSFLLMLGSDGPLYILLTLPPLSFFRFPSRYLLIFIFGMVVISGYGFDYVRQKLKSRINTLLPVLLLSISIINLFYIWINYHYLVPKFQFDSEPKIITELKKFKVDRIYAHKANMRLFTEFNNTDTKNKINRFLNYRNDLIPNSSIVYNIPSFSYYSSFAPKRLDYMMQLFEDPYTQATASSSLISEAGMKMLSIRNTSHIVSPVVLKNSNLTLLKKVPWDYPKDNYSYIYKNSTVLPEIYAYNRYRDIQTHNDFMQNLYDNTFDITKETLIENRDFVLSNNLPLEFKVSNLSKDQTHYNFQIEVNQNALISIALTYYPGWEAHIDGNITKIYPLNLVNQGILISKGNHKVLFNYSPNTYKISFFITVLSYLTVLVYIIKYFFNKLSIYF